MRKLAHLILILGLVACGAKDDDEPAGAGGAAGEAGEGGSGAGGQAGEAGDGSGGMGGEAGDSGTTGGSGGASGEAGGGSGGMGGEGGDGGGPPVVVPLTQVPGEFAGAICDALEACVGETKLLDLTSREDCDTRITAELEAGELAYIDASIGAGRVLYDPAQLEECLEGIRDMGCAVATDTYPDACVQVLEGNVELGGECTISSECEGTAFCNRVTCPSTCQPLLEEGDDCSADDECGDEMLCLAAGNDRLCKTLAPEGEACGAGSGEICAFGYSCINFTEDSPGECTVNAEVQAGDVDDECSPTGVLCNEGLSCVPVSADPEEWRCKEGVGEGETCLLALPGQCPNDQYCDAQEFFAEGTCVPLPQDGGTCVLNQLLCAPGFGCVEENEAPVCRRIEDNGESCSGDGACRSGNCADGECAPPVVCE